MPHRPQQTPPPAPPPPPPAPANPRGGGGGPPQPRLLATVEHQTTMRDLILRVYTAEASARLAPNGRSRWVRPTTAARLGIGAATRKILEAVANR